ncbi:hypothetical protein U2F10_09620 [Leptothoe sp. EHU-05/26/07-4]
MRLDRFQWGLSVYRCHGALSPWAELEAYRQMLMDVRGVTESAIANGLSLEVFLASDLTTSYDPIWGQGFLSPE